MKLTIASFFCALPLVAACAIQPGAPDESKPLPAVETAPMHPQDEASYNACMDRCTGSCDKSVDPGCSAIGDWGSWTLDCDAKCKSALGSSSKGGRGSGGTIYRHKL